ncbi:MAG TPA: NADP-dependent oxidoreductase [Candidatus Limnocylindrales bacterium]|nr:NADP-dependent oxidoreductase [Candidatus Limnocylindrales bacterium]
MTIQLPKTAQEIRLARHPEGALALEDFDIVDVPVAEPSEGQVLVRTDLVPVAAAFKEMMRAKSPLPMPTWQLGQRIGTPAIGTVVVSKSPDLSEGDLVMSMTGWGEFSTGEAAQYFKLDRNIFPSPAYYLNQGLPAYYGMVEMARVGEGDVVYISGAAGGVGSLAGQIAKCRGAKQVIGSAGGKEKVDYLLRDLGFHSAFGYDDGPVVDNLRRLAPEGINVFFDVVGGEHFEAAVEAAAAKARFALCGSLSSQLGDADGRPRFDVLTAIGKHLELRPFATPYTQELMAAWGQHFGQWLGEGRFVFPHTVVEGGLSQAPHAFMSLEAGAYTGNVSVAVTPTK